MFLWFKVGKRSTRTAWRWMVWDSRVKRILTRGGPSSSPLDRGFSRILRRFLKKSLVEFLHSRIRIWFYGYARIWHLGTDSASLPFPGSSRFSGFRAMAG
jgi:hypothetical protein